PEKQKRARLCAGRLISPLGEEFLELFRSCEGQLVGAIGVSPATQTSFNAATRSVGHAGSTVDVVSATKVGVADFGIGTDGLGHVDIDTTIDGEDVNRGEFLVTSADVDGNGISGVERTFAGNAPIAIVFKEGVGI